MLFGKRKAAPTAATHKFNGVGTPGTPAPVPPEAENLRRWRESGQPRAWVEARRGHWNHEDWIGLLETLRRSQFWPMEPHEVGRVLEETKQDWLRRQ
jgi:hypothetical protein